MRKRTTRRPVVSQHIYCLSILLLFRYEEEQKAKKKNGRKSLRVLEQAALCFLNRFALTLNSVENVISGARS